MLSLEWSIIKEKITKSFKEARDTFQLCGNLEKGVYPLKLVTLENIKKALKKTEWPKNSGLCVEKKFAVFTCAAKRVSLRAFK